MDAFHSDGYSKQSQNQKVSFNSLGEKELLESRKGRELIDVSAINGHLDNFHQLRVLIGDANAVAEYGDEETENAYFEHVFEYALGIDITDSKFETEKDYCYRDLVEHLDAVNSQLDSNTLRDIRDA